MISFLKILFLYQLNEMTRSDNEINENPFEAFEKKISRVIEGNEDLAYCISLLIIEGLLNKWFFEAESPSARDWKFIHYFLA